MTEDFCPAVYILVDKSMVYSYNNLSAQISASKSQNDDFESCLLMLIDKELSVSCSHVTDYFFFNRMVTVHIKPTAPHHTTVLTGFSEKKIQLPILSHTLFLLEYRKTWIKMEPWPKVDVLP